MVLKNLFPSTACGGGYWQHPNYPQAANHLAFDILETMLQRSELPGSSLKAAWLLAQSAASELKYAQEALYPMYVGL